MQLGRLVAFHDLGTRSPEGQLVGGVVLEERQPDHDQEHRHQTDVQVLEQDNREHDIEQPEQETREEHPQGEPGVATV